MISRVTPGLLWRLARPRGMPLVLALPAFGYGFAHWEQALPLRNPAGFVAVLGSWWFLSAGTLWLNAAFDRDDGEVLMGSAAPSIEVPPSVWGWGYLALGLAVASGFAAGAAPVLCVSVCAVLAVAYSHPRTAWKADPVLGPLVNLAGYGLLSPVAGYLLVGVPPTVRTAGAQLLVLAWIAATYFGAQAFQQREDSLRGYRTLVVTHGPRVTLAATRTLYGLAIGGLVLGGIAGWFPRLVVTAVLPWALLDRHLSAWAAEPERGVAAARGMLQRATFLAVWVMGAVTVEHLWRFSEGLPLAGMGTAWQPDR